MERVIRNTEVPMSRAEVRRGRRRWRSRDHGRGDPIGPGVAPVRD